MPQKKNIIYSAEGTPKHSQTYNSMTPQQPTGTQSDDYVSSRWPQDTKIGESTHGATSNTVGINRPTMHQAAWGMLQPMTILQPILGFETSMMSSSINHLENVSHIKNST